MSLTVFGGVKQWLGDVGPTERIHVGLAMIATAALGLAHVLATKDYGLIGDEGFYDAQARLFADGHLYSSVFPLTELHATAWKTPGLPTWIGAIYTVSGSSATAVGVAQSLIIGPLVVGLTWILARRLFGPTVGVVAGWLAALMPLLWESYAFMLPEALTIPFVLAALILLLTCEPSPKIAIWLGVFAGLAILIRPNSFFLLAGALVAWAIAVGLGRGIKLTLIAAGIAVLIVLPWSVRNQIVTDGFVPLSVQDAAGYGTFNDEAANDDEHPYRWRPTFDNGTEPAILLESQRNPEITESEIRSDLTSMMWDYIGEHPESVPKAFFWNGIVRLWDLRTPGAGLEVIGFSAHSRAVHRAGLIVHLVLLPFILYGLWRLRRRPRILAAILAMFLVLSVTTTVDGTTRYRLPVQPLLLVIAASTLPASWRRLDPHPAESAPTRAAPATVAA